MATIKDIDDLTKASSIAGTEKIPISGTEYVDLAQVKEYATPDVDGAISTHNTSTTAHADIRTLIGSCVGLPTYNSATYELTFATTSGTSLVIDLPIEQMNLDYNDTTNAIEFVKADGTTASIPVSDFLSEYVGSIGDQIQISIESGNTIKATLIDGTVTLAKLSTSLQSKIAEIDSKVDAVLGMGLSSNDYTSTEKTKLSGIAEGADVTPTLATVATSGSYNDLDNLPDAAEMVELDVSDLIWNYINNGLTESVITTWLVSLGLGETYNDAAIALFNKLKGVAYVNGLFAIDEEIAIADTTIAVITDALSTSDSSGSDPVSIHLLSLTLMLESMGLGISGIRGVKIQIQMMGDLSDGATVQGITITSLIDYTDANKTKLAGIEEGANKTLYDTTPTADSTNAVTSGGVKSYVDTAVGELSSVATVTGYSGATAMESGVSYEYSSSPSIVTFSLATVASGRIGIYSLKFTTGTSVPTFSYPSGLEWVGGELTLEASTTYELNIMNGVVTYISY